MRPRHRTALSVLILTIGFALRIWGLAHHSIWWDEGIGVWLARMPMLESIRWTAGDVHPPLYYIILRGWLLVSGEGEFVQRFPSALFSFLTIALIYRLGREIGGQRTGWLSALFLSLSRFAIWWAQEIRMYALAALLATAALWSATRIWREPAGKRAGWAWLLHIGATLGGLYTLYLSATVAVVTNFGFLTTWLQRVRRDQPHRTLLRRWLLAQGTIVLLFAPWIAYALPRMHGWSSDAAFAPAFFVKLYTTMLTRGSPLHLDSLWPLTLSVFIGLAAVTALLVRRPLTSYQAGGLALLASGLLLPPLAVVAISLPGVGFYISRPLAPRYLLPLSSCYYTLLAWGLVATRQSRRRPTLRRVLVMLVTGLSLTTALIGLRSFYPGRARRDDFVTIATVLEAHRRPEDAVVLYVDRDWPIFTAHYAGQRHDLSYGADLSDPAVAASLLAPIWEDVDGIWLITTPESLQTDPLRTIPQWLDTRAIASTSIVDGANTLTFYARTGKRAQGHQTLADAARIPTSIATSYGLVGVDIPLSRYRTGDIVHVSLFWSGPPPTGSTLQVQGPQRRRVIEVPGVPASEGIVRSQIDLALTPDLPRGTYELSVHAPGAIPTVLGDFTLLRRTVGAETTPEQIPHPVSYRLGETIHLVGYALPEETFKAGDIVPLTLYWRADQPISARYKVFTHLLGDTFNADTGNFLWGQQDSEPVNGQAQTTLWTPGVVIADSYQIPVAPNAPAGSYTLEVGMYGLTDGVRLAVEGPEGAVPDNAITLAVVEIEQP